jgi:predicted Zn finger-like uncharacterized protein
MFRAMANTDSALVVISCPHCGTRYQLPWEAIGAKGRTVACAHCGQSWEAHAARPVSADTRLSTLAEEELDARLVAEEQRQRERRAAVARREEPGDESTDNVAVLPVKGRGGKAGAGPTDAEDDDSLPADLHGQTMAELARATAKAPAPAEAAAGNRPAADRRRQQTDFSRRQQSLYNSLPRAKARRLARYAALGAILVVFGGGLLLRDAIVTQFPQLAAPYAAIGLPVNIVGLRFTDVRTLESLQSGAEVLVVDGSVESVSSGPLDVPPVVVTLFDGHGNSLYAWSVTPKASRLRPGEAVAFETRLTGPPDNAVKVHLTFGSGSAAGKPAMAPLIDTGAGMAPDNDGDKAGTTNKTDRGQ